MYRMRQKSVNHCRQVSNIIYLLVSLLIWSVFIVVLVYVLFGQSTGDHEVKLERALFILNYYNFIDVIAAFEQQFSGAQPHNPCDFGLWGLLKV